MKVLAPLGKWVLATHSGPGRVANCVIPAVVPTTAEISYPNPRVLTSVREGENAYSPEV